MNSVRSAASVAAVCVLATFCPAEMNVWIDTTDFERRLDEGSDASGTPFFSGSQKEQVLLTFRAELTRIYDGYNINFTNTDPGGDRNIIRLGAEYGVYTARWGATNVSTIGNHQSNAEALVYTKNFGVGILPGLPGVNRATELGAELAFVAAHELGHIAGLKHWHKFGAASITPATYLTTGDAPFTSLMATSTPPFGIAGRHNLNRFERALFDISGGTSKGGDTFVNQPVYEVNEATDAGATPATAMPLHFAEGETSGMRLAMHRGQLNESADDVDLYSFTTTSAGLFTTNLFSGSTYFFDEGRNFNARLRLLASDGVTVIADFDDLYYDSDVFNHPTYVDAGGFTINVPKGADDPYMLNIPIDVGTYFLEVSPVSDNSVGDGYQFLAAFDGTAVFVPEPAGLTLLLAGCVLGLARRR